MTWYISNLELLHSGLPAFDGPGYSYGSDSGFFGFSTGDKVVRVLIDGYIIPRVDEFNRYSHLDQHNLVKILYEEYGMSFIDHIKGIFSLILFVENGFHIFTDHHSVKKYFLFREGETFLISDSMKFISQNRRLETDPENAAMFCLFTHFTGGTTLFKNVSYSQPATLLSYNGKALSTGQYWKPDSLLSLERNGLSFEEMAERWKKINACYLDYFKPSQITLTLTGGNDSRMNLATLLGLGRKPNAFTFGNPDSLDGTYGRRIGKELDLNYHNHFVTNPTPEWFEKTGRKLVVQGNSLINIHRAHRYEAILEEMKANPGNEMIYVGDMGGEYIKNRFVYNDYIISKLFRLWDHDNEQANRQAIMDILSERHFDAGKTDLDKLHTKVASLEFIRKKGKWNNFFAEFCFDAALHHTQDMNIYLGQIEHLVSPFMDIDSMEMIFSSAFNLATGKKGSRFNLLKKIRHADFHVYITHALAPGISDIPYGKRGYYTANEYIGNPVVFAYKRLKRYRRWKQFTPNFPYHDWIAGFAENSVRNLSPSFAPYVLKDQFLEDLKTREHKQHEGYWHDFTNVINLDYISSEYLS